MIDEIDDALRAFCSAACARRAAVDFDAPTAEWSRAVKAPTLNLFLYDVRENRDGRAGDWADMRDDDGNVVGLQPPVRRFDLAYLVAAWGGSTLEQHALLGAVVTALPAYDCLPTEHLSGGLAEHGLSVGLRVGAGAEVIDLWSSLGQPARTSLTLVVTAPVLPQAVTELAPPASSIDLGLAAAKGRRGRSPTPSLPDPPGSTTPRTRPEPSTADDVGGEPTGAPAGGGREERRWTAYRVREHITPAER